VAIDEHAKPLAEQFERANRRRVSRHFLRASS
jgi:hypothetical protein